MENFNNQVVTKLSKCECKHPSFDDMDYCMRCGKFRGFYLNAIFMGYEKQTAKNIRLRDE